MQATGDLHAIASGNSYTDNDCAEEEVGNIHLRTGSANEGHAGILEINTGNSYSDSGVATSLSSGNSN